MRIDIFNPNIELLEPSTKDSYFEDIVMGYSIYTINRSDIILKEKLNFLKQFLIKSNLKSLFQIII